MDNTSNHLTHRIQIIGGASSLLYLSLAFGSRSYGDLGLIHLLSVAFICAFLSFWLWYQHYKHNQQISLYALIGFAILFRIIGGFTFPILEDDFYRYLWDGRQTWHLGSPYGVSPATSFDDATLSDQFHYILDSINYPEIATVYGPTCQWLFALSYLIAPGEVWPLQLILGLADIALILVLLKLAKPNSVLLYAWCPLVIKEFVITAHPDVLGALFVICAFYMHQRKNLILVGALIALAAGIKIFALILLPFLLQFNWRGWLSFGLSVLIVSLPFGIVQAWFPEGLRAMGSDWLFNAPMYRLLGEMLSLFQAKLLLLTFLGLVCAAQFWKIVIIPILELNNPSALNEKSPFLHERLRADLLFGALFLCAPAFNAWYLVWLLPFAVIRPSLWAWLLSVTIFLSYASGINLQTSTLEPYAHPAWIIVLEFLPPALVFTLTLPPVLALLSKAMPTPKK